MEVEVISQKAVHQQSLKDTAIDGLAKSFRVCHISQPFYNGEGKIDVTPDSSNIICLFDENVNTVSLLTGNLLQTLQEETDPKKEIITCFALHPEGEEIVTSSQNGLLRHWKGKECLRSIKGHQMPVLAMVYDPTGTLVATGSADRTIRVWDIVRGYCTHSFRDHTDIITLLKFHPNPMTMALVSGSQDNTVRIWDLVDQKCTSIFREHMSQPTSIAWAPDEYLMVTAGRDKTMNFYEMRDKKLLKTIAVMDEVESAVFLGAQHSLALLGYGSGPGSSSSSSGKKKDSSAHVLIIGGEKGIVRLYKVVLEGKNAASFSCTPLAAFSVNDAGLADIAVSSVSNSFSGSIGQSISSIHYLASKSQLMFATSDSHFFFFDLKGTSIFANRQFIGSHDDVLDISCLPEFSSATHGVVPAKLAVATNSAIVRLMTCGSSDCQLLYGHTDVVLALDASTDGRWLATSSKDTTVRIWDLHSPKPTCVAIGTGHTDAVGTVAISQREVSFTTKQAFAVSAAGDKILKKWSFMTSKKSAARNIRDDMTITASFSIRAHDKDINCVAISPNDSLVASGSQDKTIRLWKSDDLTPVSTLIGHKRGVWKVVFSPVDRALCSSSADKTLRMWSMVDYSCLRTLEGHTASVLCCRFISHGMQVLSGSADGLVRLWDVRTGECINTFDKHEDKIWAIAVPRPSEVDREVDDNDGLEVKEAQNAPSLFYSGGSDARILTWVDCTKEEENKRLEETERYLLQEQQLANDIRNKRFGKALTAALELGHSNRVMRILSTIVQEEPEQDGNETEICSSDNIVSVVTPIDRGKKLDRYISKLEDSETCKMVTYCKEWNTNARHSHLSQLTLACMLRTIGAERLLSMKEVAEAIPALLAYSERHYQRIDRLHQAVYVLEYMSSLMALVPVEENVAIEKNGKGNGNAKRKRDSTTLVIFGSEGAIDDDDDEDEEIEPASVPQSSKKSKTTSSPKSGSNKSTEAPRMSDKKNNKSKPLNTKPIKRKK